MALAFAALSNSAVLLAEAEQLADLGSSARAYALAVLSSEELGKCQFCILVLGLSSTVVVPPKVFWDEFSEHKRRLTRSGAFDLLLREARLSDAEAIRALPHNSDKVHKRRLRALYVDYQAGLVLTPADISEREARDLIGAVRDQVSLLQRGFAASGDSETWLHAFSQADLGAMIAELRDRVSVDPDQFAASARQMFSLMPDLAAGKPVDVSNLPPWLVELIDAVHEKLRAASE
jgi:AbiV family abortive infection protein